MEAPKNQRNPKLQEGALFFERTSNEKKDINFLGTFLIYCIQNVPSLALSHFRVNRITALIRRPQSSCEGFSPTNCRCFQPTKRQRHRVFLVPLFKDEKVRRVFGNQHCTMFDQKYVFLDGLSGIQIITEMMETFSKAKNLDCFRQKYIGVDRFDIFFSDVFFTAEFKRSMDRCFVRSDVCQICFRQNSIFPEGWVVGSFLSEKFGTPQQKLRRNETSINTWRNMLPKPPEVGDFSPTSQCQPVEVFSKTTGR